MLRRSVLRLFGFLILFLSLVSRRFLMRRVRVRMVRVVESVLLLTVLILRVLLRLRVVIARRLLNVRLVDFVCPFLAVTWLPFRCVGCIK